MTRSSVFALLCTFLVTFGNSDESLERFCYFEYNSYHTGNDLRESRHNFTLQIRQNCSSGSFSASIAIKFPLEAENFTKLPLVTRKYLERLAENRPDAKTLIDFGEIQAELVEFEGDGEELTKISIEAFCHGQNVKNWETRCQVNAIFLMESFRTKDLKKFEKFSGDEFEEEEENDVELTIVVRPDVSNWDDWLGTEMSETTIGDDDFMSTTEASNNRTGFFMEEN